MKRKALHSMFALAIPVSALLAATPAVARPPQQQTATAAACAATPNPVAVGDAYTVTGWNLTPGAMVDVYVSDAVGLRWSSATADGSGTISVPGWANFEGTSTVTVKAHTRKATVLATCTFEVV